MGGVPSAIANAQLPDDLLTSQPDSPSSQSQPITRASTLATTAAPLPTPAPPEVLTDRYEFSGKQRNQQNQTSTWPAANGGIASQAIVLALAKPIVPNDSSSPPITVPTEPTAPQNKEVEPPRSSCPDLPTDGHPEGTPSAIQVSKFIFKPHPKSKSGARTQSSGSSIFSEHELEALLPRDYANKFFLPSELLNVACKVAELYAKAGYKTTGAVIEIKKDRLLVEVQIIEGRLERENINVTVVEAAARRGLARYIRSRLGIDPKKPLNINKLQESLQLLQFDSPLIESITARLSAGTDLGESILDVQVKPSRFLNGTLTTDNNRVPSVGSMQRRAVLKSINPLGLGDSLSVGYNNSKGSNTWDVNYVVPLSPRNITLSFNYSRSNSAVIEPPFDDLDGDGKTGDIRSSSQSYEISLRHPLIRHIIRPRPADDNLETEMERTADADRVKREEARGSVFREFAVGLTGSLRDSRTSLLGIPFPLSPGADDNGFTRVFALRFFQEFTQQDAREVLFLRSQFNVGLNALGATINTPIAGLNDVVPDSRFFFWQGQALWTRRLGSDRQKSPLLTLRANMQLSDRALVSSEQLAIGGFGTVRGYRQDILQSDNGIFATAELQIPLVRIGRLKQGAFSVIPFVDYGTGWNSAGNAPSPSSLRSTGLGLRFQYDQFTARLDWGIPLISVESRGNTWQDNGIQFSLQWNGL